MYLSLSTCSLFVPASDLYLFSILAFTIMRNLRVGPIVRSLCASDTTRNYCCIICFTIPRYSNMFQVFMSHFESLNTDNQSGDKTRNHDLKIFFRAHLRGLVFLLYQLSAFLTLGRVVWFLSSQPSCPFTSHPTI